MPRLQILHHKSYHPYNEKNKQRVREDEAKAAEEERRKEQKRVDNEAEARLNILRKRAGSPSFQPKETEEDPGDLPSTSTSRHQGDSLLERHRKEKARAEKRERKAKDRLDFDFPSEPFRSSKGKERAIAVRADDGGDDFSRREARGVERDDDQDQDRGGHSEDQSRRWEQNGHLNFFADLEGRPELNKPVPTVAELAKKKTEAELDKFTMYLSRPEKETKPWYADRELKRIEDKEISEAAEIRREKEKRKDLRSKERNDPLTTVTKLLSSHPSTSASVQMNGRSHTKSGGGVAGDAGAQRKAREQSERQRALAMIAAKSKPAYMDTPSTIAPGGSWIDDFERRKDRAGNRYFGNTNTNPIGNDRTPGGRDKVEAWREGRGTWDSRPRNTGRSWEV